MRVLTQHSPLGRRGDARWSIFWRLGMTAPVWGGSRTVSPWLARAHRRTGWRWLRALMVMLVLWAPASAAWAICNINWNIQDSEKQGNGVYRRELTSAEYAACDPNASNGIFSNSQGDTFPVTALDGSSLFVDVRALDHEYLVFTPAAGNKGPWTFTLYGCSSGNSCYPYNSFVLVNVTTPPPPTVTAVSPSAGPLAGGIPITITGTGFTGATVVFFGAKSAPSFNIDSATQITAVAPSGNNVVDVAVGTPVGTSSISAADRFTYTAAPMAGPTSTTVAHGSTNNTVPLSVMGVPTSSTVSTQATHGTATASGLNITYTPNASYSGTDTFAYTVTNAGGTSAPATVTVTVSSATVTYAPSSPAAGTVGTSYLQTLAPAASGGTGPYTYAMATGALPAGLTLNSNGTLSGTPTAAGTFNFTVAATDSSTGTGPFSATSGPLTLTINAPTISVSPALLSNATVASAYSQSLSASGGTSPYTFTVSTGSLPAGVTLSSNGTLSGTPTAGGTFNFTVTAQDSSTGIGPYTGSRAYSLNVATPTLSIAPTSGALSATAGQAYSRTFTAGGGTAPYGYTISALPPGLSFNTATGVLSGTPTALGATTFTVTATDSSTGTGPFSMSGTYTLTTVAPTIVVSPATLPNPVVATAYSQAITASGGAGPYTYAITAGSLPAGLTLSSGGTLSGTATAGGTFNFTIKATDANGFSSSGVYAIVVGSPTLSITPSSGSLNATLSQAFSQVFAGSGGTAPYHYGISINTGTLPTGLAFNAATGTLAGTPTTAGTVNFTITATDSSTGAGPFSTSGTYTLPAVAPTISVSPATLPSPAIATAYSQLVSASGGTAPYAYTVTTGVLPAGLSLNGSTGAIAGTPMAGGTFSFTVTATDANGYSGTRNLGLSIAATAITVSPGSLSGATVGTAYSQSVTASGGTAPYTYAITAGALPAGLMLTSTGMLSGTPTAGGTFNFTITSTDSSTGTGPYSGNHAYTLTVASPTMTITPASGALNGVAGTAYNRNFSANGGVGPYTYVMAVSSGTMPAGLTWNASTATLSGTPTTAGTVNFTVTATDRSTGSGPYVVTGTYALTVSAPTISVSPATLPSPAIATAYSQTVSASSGAAPYTYTVSAGALPAGLNLNGSTGAITGTPTAGGTFNFTVTATDANSFTASRAYSFNIGAPTVTVSPAAMTAAQVTTTYSQTFSATGGTAPYTYAVSTGTLPAGLSLNASTGVVSGTPTALGTNTFTVQATDSSTGTGAPYRGTRSYAIVVGQVIGTAPAVTVTTLSSTPVTVHATANATGGPFSSIAIVSAPPSGSVVINGLDIVYTPALTTSGAVNFTYALINTAGTSAPIPVTVNVNGVPVAAPQKQATTASGQAVSVDLTEGATGGPFTGATLVSVVPSNAGTASIVQKAVQAPAGVKTPAAATSTYLLNFTPSSTYSGPAVLTYTLSNAYATSMPASLQVSVTARKDPSADPDVAGLINAQVQAARRFATTQIDNYNRRLEALHGTGRAPSDNGLTVALPGVRAADAQARCQDVAGIAARDACLRGDGPGRSLTRGKRDPDATANKDDPSNADTGPDLPGADAASTGADSTDPRLAFWSAGTLDFGFANAGAQRSGFRFTTGGVTAGADYRVSDQLSVGAGFGYGRDSTDIGNAGTKSTGDSYSLALYGSYRPQPSLFVDGVAGIGTLSFDSRRWVTDASDFATGKRNGRQMFASVSAGYEHRDRTWLISPYGRLSVSQSTLDQFSESGAGINALTYFEQTVTTVSGTLGLRAEYAQKTKWGTFLPFARVEYQHDFNGQSNAGLAYADLASAGPAYYVPGTPFGRDRMQIGLGTKFRTGPLTFGLDYNVMLGMGGLQQGVRLTFSAPF